MKRPIILFQQIAKGGGRFFDFLGRVHPIAYLFFYLALVPLFAVIYTRLDGSFYAPYAQYEGAGSEDRRAVIEMLSTKLWHHLWCIDEQVNKAGGLWRFHTKELYILPKLKIEGSFVEFEAEIMLLKPERPNEPLTIPINRPVVVSRVPMQFGPIGRYPADWMQIKYNRKELEPTLQGFVSSAVPECETKLVGSETDRARVEAFVGGLNNDPLKVSGKFDRMLYFSVVVLTTLGFGDIVPMTPWSRRLVAGEAILGMIIMGLMLNAVATRARSKP
ncbi:hypothetical protein GGD63_005574 [Bradyrhizobium sp. cir1]|uniref:potassium channel family protein n=1 Tax=Bradyrhizobium sp. cir1 TaxID=1445730 RepID=UPI00182DFC1C|nr:potassium channel family protein [Bradyrhizobium sp. cir1]MBB4372762.1 hypothetical protein [Bradyrhizobium sp. cir1]